MKSALKSIFPDIPDRARFIEGNHDESYYWGFMDRYSAWQVTRKGDRYYVETYLNGEHKDNYRLTIDQMIMIIESATGCKIRLDEIPNNL